jgi:hypothetical protein
VADLDDLDPDELLNNLVFDPPGTPLDMPVPPVLGPDEQVMVHRTIDLPVDIDARLRAAAAARGMSLQDFVRSWAEHAA